MRTVDDLVSLFGFVEVLLKEVEVDYPRNPAVASNSVDVCYRSVDIVFVHLIIIQRVKNCSNRIKLVNDSFYCRRFRVWKRINNEGCLRGDIMTLDEKLMDRICVETLILRHDGMKKVLSR